MKKIRTRQLNKEIKRAITGSMGRFLSIFSLMVLGVFAFVGLKVSGPDMRATAKQFYQTHQLADLTVTSTMGLDASDQRVISDVNGVKQAEFGYFQDVLLGHSKTAVRVFSQAGDLSTYQLMSGKMPSQARDIALDYLLSKHYHLGEQITLNQEKKTTDVLKNQTFKIVGFVKSSEWVDKSNFGQTLIGTGQLKGYAVVGAREFSSDVKMIARLSFKDMSGLSPYDHAFKSRALKNQKAMENVLNVQASQRLKKIQASGFTELKKAQTALNEKNQSLDAQIQRLNSQKEAMSKINPSETQNMAVTDALKSLDDAKAQLVSAQSHLEVQKNTLRAMKAPVYTVNDRNSADSGYQTFVDNSTRIDTLSNIFPVVLFAIAALVSLTTMTRFVEEERSSLGLLKALGYTNRQIRRKFMVYGFVSATLGALVGAILGHLILPKIVFNAYSASSTFSDLKLLFSLKWTVVAFVIALLCSVFPAYWTTRETLREGPSRLFLAKAPKVGSRIFLERVPFIWEKMSFTYKVTARNLFRYKKRMLMTIVGVAGCTALLVMGFGIRDSIAGLSVRQFGSIIHYDLIAVEKDHVSKTDEKKLDAVSTDSKVKRDADIHFEVLSSLTASVDGKQHVQMIVPKDQTSFSKFVSLQNRTSQKQLTLGRKGAVISEKLAKLLHVKVGDHLTLENEDHKRYQMNITGITEMYMGHYVFMSASAYEKSAHASFDANAKMIELVHPSDKNVESMAYQLMENPSMLAVSKNTDLKTTIQSFLYGINSVMVVLIVCAILLAVVVIYNLTNINVSERIRELSTIKVLGFYDREVTLYIYRETILLSVFGIFAGFLLGAYFHRVIITMLPTDLVMFSPNLAWTNLLLSAVITMATTLLLSVMVHYKLKHVDMLGALKAID